MFQHTVWQVFIARHLFQRLSGSIRSVTINNTWIFICLKNCNSCQLKRNFLKFNAITSYIILLQQLKSYSHSHHRVGFIVMYLARIAIAIRANYILAMYLASYSYTC